MIDTQVYKQQLLDHFKNPRNKARGDMSDKAIVKRGSNPRCGDDIEVGFEIRDGQISELEFRGRGCSICLASSSMMTEVVNQQTVVATEDLIVMMQQWIAGSDIQVPELLAPLAAVKSHPARKKCVMLCWNALAEGLEEYHVR